MFSFLSLSEKVALSSLFQVVLIFASVAPSETMTPRLSQVDVLVVDGVNLLFLLPISSFAHQYVQITLWLIEIIIIIITMTTKQ